VALCYRFGAMSQHALVVEDDAAIREILVEALADEGFASTEAANGREALDRLEAGLPGLPGVIFLDMRMPVMDGWQFAAELRRRHDHLAPLVVVTAAHDAERRCREVGADGCLPKPFEIDQVATVLHRVLRDWRPGAPPAAR
jgi:CheY-like chemotaxis protein